MIITTKDKELALITMATVLTTTMTTLLPVILFFSYSHKMVGFHPNIYICPQSTFVWVNSNMYKVQHPNSQLNVLWGCVLNSSIWLIMYYSTYTSHGHKFKLLTICITFNILHIFSNVWQFIESFKNWVSFLNVIRYIYQVFH